MTLVPSSIRPEAVEWLDPVGDLVCERLAPLADYTDLIVPATAPVRRPGPSGTTPSRVTRVHGDENGYRQHLRYHETACDSCKQGHRDYQARWRADNPDKRRAHRATERARIKERNAL